MTEPKRAKVENNAQSVTSTSGQLTSNSTSTSTSTSNNIGSSKASDGIAGVSNAERVATPTNTATTGRSDKLPIPIIGAALPVLWRDGSRHDATVLQVKDRGSLHSSDYYVHYNDYDRRLDEWIQVDRIDLDAYRRSLEGGSTKEGGTDTSPKKPVRKMTRNMKRKHDEASLAPPSIDDMDPATAALEREHEKVTRIKYIHKIALGKYEIDTWYFSPYPDEYGKAPKLYICEWCFKYMMHPKSLQAHVCPQRQPPGLEIYRQGRIAVYEVDGKDHKLYCQNLCLLAKLFLDHKTLYFDVEPFLFYVLTEVEPEGAHVVGYFSKEKCSLEGNNLACILTLPPYQKKGYGRFLIQFSYALSKLENKVGSPEKPLSDLGRLSYRGHWGWELLHVLKDRKTSISVAELSDITKFSCDDIVYTLQTLSLLKYWKGAHIVCVAPKLVDELLQTQKFRPPQIPLDEACIKWTPPVFNTPSTSKH